MDFIQYVPRVRNRIRRLMALATASFRSFLVTVTLSFITVTSFRINFQTDESEKKNFVNGLQNARNIIEGLQRSLNKSKQYEKQLLDCHSRHPHSHVGKYWWDSQSEDKDSKGSKTETTKSTRNQVDLAASWSTMSIVCLQYQYEELSNRYESLLRAYDERCSQLHYRDTALAELKQKAIGTHAHLTQAHEAVVAVGEKYLALREKRLAEKMWYEAKIHRLKSKVREVMATAELARVELDSQVACSMADESDTSTSLLLAEIRKCNLLFLENLRLKAKIEELAPELVS